MRKAIKPFLKRAWLPACLALAGCATQQQQSSLECGVGGAAVGYLACKAFGGKDSDCARLAVVGGVVGGAVCYSYAGRLEKRKKELAGREQDLNAQLQYVRGLNEDGQQLNAELRQRVEAATQRVAQLSAKTGQQRASADQIAKERKQLDEEYNAANKQVALQSGALAEAKGFQTKRASASPDLDSEIAKQERLLADAQRQLAALSQLRERVG